ncbi:hypothetical protein M8J75_015058 [Diaphorina citri]|nr:hypothetical protein M8J75_015058 [Diaphorina citri]
MADHFSTMNNFIKSADYLTKPKQKRSSGNAFGISRRKDYTSEEKLFFVNLVLEGGNSKASVAKQYDIPESTLRGWCKPKHKDKLEKEAHDRKTTANVFDTPSPSSSSSSAGSGVTSAALYHPYKDSPFDHHPTLSSAGIVPTLQIPKLENLYYNQQTPPLRCRSAMADPRPLIKEERDEEVLNLSNKTGHHLTSPILTQCLNSTPTPTSHIKSELSPSNSIKSMQSMKQLMSPNNLMDSQHNISTMFQSYAKSPHPTFGSDPLCKLSPKPTNSPSPVQYGLTDKHEDVNVNKRKYEAFVNDVNKDITSSTPYDPYKKEVSPVSNNNNSEFYKNYEQFLNNKRSSDMYNTVNKMEPKRDSMFNSPSGNQGKIEPAESPVPPHHVNNYFKNYLESVVKAQKLPGAPNVPGGQEQFKLAAQQLWLQQLALNQLAASSMSQLPNAMQQQQQTAAALQQQQLLYERQLLNSRLNQQQGATVPTPGGVHPEEKLYSWTSQLHANQRELEEKLKLLIQTQQQILSDKSQSPPEPHITMPGVNPDQDRIKRLRTMNVRDMLETHRQSLEKSQEVEREEEARQEEEEEEMSTDQEVKETLDLSKPSKPAELLNSPPSHLRESPASHHSFRRSPLNRLSESPMPLITEHSNTLNVDYTSEHNVAYDADSAEDSKPLQLCHTENYLENAILHGEQFLEDLEKVSHPKLTLQHIRQLRDLLGKLKTPVFENNNSKDMMEDPNNKSKRKSLLNIVHNLTN